MRKNVSKRIAVVGFGPRGLGALEALAARLPEPAWPLSVDVFEPFEAPGAGPNFDPLESEVCRLNIPLRDIDIRAPDGIECNGFADWLGDSAQGPDDFPARATLGRYLEARLEALLKHPALSITHQPIRITGLRGDDGGWTLDAEGDWHGPYAEVLLALGQPEVEPDAQLADWQAHERRSSGELASAYPAQVLVDRAKDWAGRVVAIRGLALSAFDVIRVLTVAQGGRFAGEKYIPSGKEPVRILPFSLDGFPPYPKPETEDIDRAFEPKASEMDRFLENMSRAATGEPDEARRSIASALAPVVLRILREVGGEADAAAINRWLETEWSTPGSQESVGPVEALHDGIAMAEGRLAPSIGYTVGQVWRKWQDTLRKGYNPVHTAPQTAETIVAFDESLKRYSYGPPVTSSRELRSLIEAGVVDLSLSTDPEIEPVDQGWTLRVDGREATAGIMIDGVLPSPDLSIVNTPLVTGLVSQGRLSTMAEGLGGRIDADGTLRGTEGQATPGVALLGRLALGSVIAVDSLHDCFGEASYRWAAGVVSRLGAPGEASVR